MPVSPPAPPDNPEYWAAVKARLRLLRTTAEWDTFVELAQARRAQKVQALVTGAKEDFERLQGMIQGMDELLGLPERILEPPSQVVSVTSSRISYPA